MDPERSMTRKCPFSFLPFLCLLAQLATAEDGVQLSYDCTAADGSTRQIKSSAYCSAERPLPSGQDACRVEYTKDGSTEVLWRARNDPSYCQPKVEELVGKLEDSGFSCAVTGGPLCDDSVALAAPRPKEVPATDPGRGTISITPSNRSSNRSQDKDIKRQYEIDHPTSVRHYLTFTRDARFGYFLAVLDSRLTLSASGAGSRSSSEEDADPLETCIRNRDLNVTFEKLEEFIRRQFNSQSSSDRVVENVHAFLASECDLEKASSLNTLERAP